MFQAQHQAYVRWVNSQLKKLPGSRAIHDLRTDLRDGVALAQLIHVVGKYNAPGGALQQFIVHGTVEK